MAFTELYCRAADGSNLNSGSTNTAAASLTYASGSWVSATRVFTVASGDPVANGIAVDDVVSVYANGSTVTGFVGFVTARTTTTITVHATRSSGTPPADGVGNRTLKKGGAWKGPNGAENFPFNFVAGTMINASGLTPRVTFIGTFNITAAMSHAITGPVRFQGATTAAGDGGKAVIDGGAAGASYALLAVNASGNTLVDLILQNNGATGNAWGVVLSGSGNLLKGCVVNNVRGIGIFCNHRTTLLECEIYACNQSNTAGWAGVYANFGGAFIRCISHHNAGSNNTGFLHEYNEPISYIRCIAHTNGAAGFTVSAESNYPTSYLSCEAYNNAGDGLNIKSNYLTSFYIENCNFVKNGGWGINGSGSGARLGEITNCGFGTGSQANASGTITGLSAMAELNSVLYSSDTTPWEDPVNGDFRISLEAAKNSGRGSFTQTASGYAGTIGFPDIGAAQHDEIAHVPGAAPTRGRGMAQYKEALRRQSIVMDDEEVLLILSEATGAIE
jgi:hypothetical protein